MLCDFWDPAPEALPELELLPGLELFPEPELPFELEPLPELELLLPPPVACRAAGSGTAYCLPAGELVLTGGGAAAEATPAKRTAPSTAIATSPASRIAHLYHRSQRS